METRKLLEQICREDSEPAFRALFDAEYARIFRLAFYFMQDDELAKELTLDLFADLWARRKTMVVPQDFRHYSFAMVRNAAINLWNREHRQVHEALEATSEEASSGFSPEDLLEQSELFERYELLLAQLPERCREVFCLVKEEGRSYAEVAETLHIAVKTVDAQLQKALHHLREGLSSYRNTSSGKRFFAFFL